MLMTELIRRVRLELGDPVQPFMTTSIGDGMTQVYDIPKQNLQPGTFTATTVIGVSTTTLVSGVDYQLDLTLGLLTLTNVLPFGALLAMNGYAWGLFTDDDLTIFLQDAVNQHCLNRKVRERMRTRQGFISFRETPLELYNLPDIEEPMVVALATINTLWVLANDAATDADIQTAEGTVINRTGRYAQLMTHIDQLQERYERMAAQLNVGMYRTETMQLRRVSYTTGRYIPVFTPREYDDHTWPTRQVVPIDEHSADESGIPSPLWNSQGY